MRHTFDYIRRHKILLFLIIFGLFFLMGTILPSGTYYCYQKRCGLFFWGANGHDAVWHLALASTSFKTYPFISPVYAGALLTGYNYLMDLVLYLLSLIKISISFSYFKLFPLLWFFTITVLTVLLGRKIKDSWHFVALLLFFTYFGSSFTFLFPLYHNKNVWGASSLLSMQSGQVLTNMQFALSLVFLLAILLLIKEKHDGIKKNLLLGVLIFINLGLKLYAGIVSIVVVSVYYVFKHFESKQILKFSKILLLIRNLIIIAIFFLASVFLFFNPLVSLKTGPAFIFSPFATMHSLIEEPSLFYLKDMVNARYYLYAYGGLLKSPRLWTIELFSSALFLFFSLGLRILGIVYFIIKLIKRKLNSFDVSIFLAATFAYLLLVLFIQKGHWWNIIQFYYYSLFLLNIFTAQFFYEVIKNSQSKLFIYGVIFLIVAVSLPGNIDIARNFFTFPAHSYIPEEELKALAFLKKQPDGIVFGPIFDKQRGENLTFKPLFAAEDSAYISAFSSKSLYLADRDVLVITGIVYESRLARIKNGDCTVFNEIKYVYQFTENPDQFIQKCLSYPQPKFKKIFNNSLITIYSKV